MKASISQKACSACGSVKPIEDYRFDNVVRQKRKVRCRDCENRRAREDRAKHRDKRRAGETRHYRRTADHHYLVKVKRVHGLTDHQAEVAIATTECDICGRDNGSYRLNVDHCHATGQPRGILCTRCNFALGQFADDPDVMRRAVRYLERNGEGRWS